jgi:predicted dehydrogenase
MAKKHAGPQPTPKPASDKLRIGVIGVGMGKAHVNGYREHPSAEVVALADLNEERLKAVGAELDVTTLYTDAEKMLDKEKLDIVSVATPNKFHKPLTIAGGKSSMHHFVDAIVTGHPHIATGEEGQTVMKLLDAIYLSAEKGEPVKIG